MLLSEVAPDSGVELRVTIGNQTLSFETKSLSFPDKSTDRHLYTMIKRGIGTTPAMIVPAIQKDEKTLVFPKSGAVYQVIVQDKKENKPFLWPAVLVKLVKPSEGQAYHVIYSSQNVKEWNRRERYRLWLGVDGVVNAGLERIAMDCVIKDISSTGIAFVIRKDVMEKHEMSFNPQDLVVLTFFDEPSNTHFRLTALVLRSMEIDESRVMFGCKFAEENLTVGQFVTKRQRERLKEQRQGFSQVGTVEKKTSN